MRELIRPTLFLLARAGLLLRVGAWGVGQWIAVGVAAGNFRIGCHRSTWSIGWDSRTNGFRAATYLSEERDSLEKHDLLWLRRLHRLSGLAARWRWPIPWIMVNHRLIVTIFALFYGALKWVYRKRATEVPHE